MEKEKFFLSEGDGIPHSWNSIFGMEIHSSEQLQNCLFNPNWDNSMDQSDPFESALSSIVSSPANSHSGIPIPAAGDSVVLRELIGRLGSICNSGDISPHSYLNGNNSTNTSGYTTPLNSPPKLNLSIMDHQIQGNLSIQRNHQLPLPSDPGFVERASRFSSFSGKKFMGIQEEIDEIPASGKKFSRLAMSSTPENTELGDSMEESSVSEQIPGGGIGIKSQSQSQTTHNSGRKRKAIPKGKGKETPSSTQDDKIVAEEQKDESEAKRSKSNEERKENAEPPKDYIHVRARRGQATDSHSLAERVRREKISERMKFLQDLVPGCNKVTGKAVMLDEIINYVQSLQRQVEFLSMKLATVNPRMDVTMEALLSKDMFQSLSSMANNINHLDNSPQPFPYGFQSQHNGIVLDGKVNRSSMNPLMVAMYRDSNMKPPHIDGFGEASTFWENDLQSVVQMGLGQNQPQSFHGSMATGQMKVEQ